VAIWRLELHAASAALWGAVLVVAAAIVSGVLALAVARTSLRALDDLADTVERLGRGELEARYPMRGTGEVDRLGHDINLMADQLEAARGELDREKADIKQRVTGQTRELQQANRLLMDIANRDVLTGLANRRRLELELERYISLSKRTGVPLAVVMIDLDKFKQYNDAAGHLAGDALLQAVASTLRARARATDLVVRWGGDEFCILVPGAGPDGALKAAEGFVGAIREAAAAFQLPDGEVVVGASAGVACYPGDGGDGTELIARADEALYQVKATGRGRVLRLPRS
jgi:diguanylate cyclase (GGDEF)-like protein